MSVRDHIIFQSIQNTVNNKLNEKTIQINRKQNTVSAPLICCCAVFEPAPPPPNITPLKNDIVSIF